MKSGDREQITLRIPTETKEEIAKEATRLGISINAYILILIDKGRQCLQWFFHFVLHSRKQKNLR